MVSKATEQFNTKDKRRKVEIINLKKHSGKNIYIMLPPSFQREQLKPSEAGWVEILQKLPSAILGFHF